MIRKNKAQVTIFIIIAILIVAVIVLFFFLMRQGKIFAGESYEPQPYMEECAKKSAIEAVDIMMQQGGYISPSNYKLFQDKKVAYLCYNKNFYLPCVNQQPMYIEFLETEIKNYIEPKIKDCFSSLKQELEKRNYKIEEGNLDLSVNLALKRVDINMKKKFNLKKNEEKINYDEFKARVISPLYDLAVIAQEIASQEAKFCYFEYLGYSLAYPSFVIDKFVTGDDIKIYTITDKTSKKNLKIAIRSCARSAGF